MILFNPAVVGFVLSAFALSQCSAAEDSIRARRLSYPIIAGYEPQTLVTDTNAIDLDVAAMYKQLKLNAWSEAHHIYKDGAHTKMYANMTLTEPLKKRVPIDTKVEGKAQNGGTAKGRTIKEADVGEKFIAVQYHVHDKQDGFVDCQVGALWRTHNAKLDGCFHEDGGALKINNIGVYNYTYDIRKDNNAARTLQLLSTSADTDMMRCDGCPYPTIEKFFDYYGTAQYGDEYVTSAFESKATNFKNGNIDFSKANNQSRIEAITKGTVSMNIYMAVIRKMEDAVAECERGSSRPKTLSWDEAVAFYTGSKEGTNGQPTGELLHELADSRCANFHTCGSDAHKASGHAKVNYEIFQQFKFGQRNLANGNCAGARENKELIENRMMIPMIQGILRYAHINGDPETKNTKYAAEGTAYAAAVLPLVNSCNPRAAEAINANMNFGASTSFYHVKNALQETYKCLGITCEDVGGYWDAASAEYFEGAGPCTGTGGSGVNAVAIAVVITIAVVGIVAAAVVIARRRRKAEAPPKKNPIFVTPEEPFT